RPLPLSLSLSLHLSLSLSLSISLSVFPPLSLSLPLSLPLSLTFSMSFSALPFSSPGPHVSLLHLVLLHVTNTGRNSLWHEHWDRMFTTDTLNKSGSFEFPLAVVPLSLSSLYISLSISPSL